MCSRKLAKNTWNRGPISKISRHIGNYVAYIRFVNLVFLTFISCILYHTQPVLKLFHYNVCIILDSRTKLITAVYDDVKCMLYIKYFP